MHHLELIGPITHTKHSLPFITFGDADQIVGPTEVNFCEDAHRAQMVEEVGNERKRVTVLLGDSVEAMVVDREAKGTVFFLDEEDRGTGRGLRGVDEVVSEVLIYELMKGELLDCGEGVDQPKRGCCTGFQFDCVVIRTVGRQGSTLALAEDIQVVVVCCQNGLVERLIFVVQWVKLSRSGVSRNGGGCDETGIGNGGVVGWG